MQISHCSYLFIFLFNYCILAVSMFLGVVLRYIPTAVLFGVFLYMGVASLGGIQLFDRIILLITPTKHHPVDIGYVRYVSRIRTEVHLFYLRVGLRVTWVRLGFVCHTRHLTNVNSLKFSLLNYSSFAQIPIIAF